MSESRERENRMLCLTWREMETGIVSTALVLDPTDEGKLAIGYGCDIVVFTEEKTRNSKHRLQPAATMPALYSTGFV